MNNKEEKNLKDGISDIPENVDSLRAIGSACLDSGKTREAIEVLERACELDPANGESFALLGRAEALRVEEVENLAEQMDLATKALVHINMGAIKSPEKWLVRLTHGVLSLYTPDIFRMYKRGIEDLNYILELKEKDPKAVPDSFIPQVYFSLGEIYEKNKLRDCARAMWLRLLEEYPESDYSEKAKQKLKH